MSVYVYPILHNVSYVFVGSPTEPIRFMLLQAIRNVLSKMDYATPKWTTTRFNISVDFMQSGMYVTTSVPTVVLSANDTRRCGHVGCRGLKVRNRSSMVIDRCYKVLKTTFRDLNMCKSCTMTITSRILSRRYNF